LLAFLHYHCQNCFAVISFSCCSAAIRLDSGHSLLPKNGPPFKVSPEDLTAVVDVIRTRAVSGNAVLRSEFPKLLEKQRRATQLNEHQRFSPISRSTLFSASTNLDLAQVSADIQTRSRAVAKADLRNGISMCAVTAACIEHVIPQLLFCYDEVSFFLENKKKPVVFVPRDLVAELRASHQGVKVTAPKHQRRVVSMLNFVSRDGVRLHTALRVKDDHIHELREHLISPSLSIWFYPIHFNETLFVSKFFTSRILPAVCEKRSTIAAGLLAGSEVLLSGQLPQFVALHGAAVDAKALDLRSVVCMDGDGAQTQAFMDGKLGEVCSGLNVEYLKLSASCSGHESALDLSKSHQLMRQAIHSPHYDYDIDPIPSFAMTLFIKDVLNKSGIASASLLSFRKFFIHVEALMDRTFNVVDLQHGWQLAGVSPLSCSTILSHCPGWQTLRTSEANRVLAAIPSLTELVRLKGELTDVEIQAAIGGAVDFGPPVIKPFGAVNRRRCVWGNNKGFVVAYASKKQAEAQAKVVLQQKRDDKAAAMKRKAEQAADKENKPPSKKRSKVTAAAVSRCSNPDCLVLWCAKSVNPAVWLGCDFCPLWFCPKPECKAMFGRHEAKCSNL